MVKPIPDGMSGATPYLAVHDAAAALEFYRSGFGAVEVMPPLIVGGKVAHAEFKIGDALIMLADEDPQYRRSPKTLGGTTAAIHLYVEDVDAFAARAAAAGAKIVIPVGDQFYGDRSGRIEDPFGHLWVVSTHKEDLSPEEIQRRFDEMMKPAS